MNLFVGVHLRALRPAGADAAPVAREEEETMTRAEFEQLAVKHNAARDAAVVKARVEGGPCETIDMLAFGGIPYCRTHRSVGPCPFAGKGA